MSATFTIRTLGCKVNQYDSQLLAERLGALGLSPRRMDDGSPDVGVEAEGAHEAIDGGLGAGSNGVDLVVVNTCAVTARSEAKGRRLVRWLLRRHPDAAIVVTGCGVRLDAHPWRAIGRQTAPGRLLVVASPEEVPERLVEAGLVGTGGPSRASLPSGAAALPARISGFLGHDRAFVKVQDGCQAFCSYCVVPLVRPRLWSKRAGSVVEEVRALSGAGYGEVVLVGVHLGLYGSEAPEDTHDESRNPDLAGLVRRLLAETDVGRLRLSSVEPQEVTDDLIDLAVESDRVCPHFHLPLQSGDDSVLRAMNRRYTVREYLQTLERIARRIPRPAFTTDILLGFPGEGEAEFERTLSVVREARFSRIHAFRYSPRPGTKAAARSSHTPQWQVLRRERELLALAGELARAYRNQFLGEVVEVLVEGRADNMASPTRVPAKRAGGAVTDPPGAGGRQVMELKRQESLAGLSERYLRVRFPRLEGHYVRPGSLVKVRVLATDDAGLVGRRDMKVGAGKK